MSKHYDREACEQAYIDLLEECHVLHGKLVDLHYLTQEAVAAIDGKPHLVARLREDLRRYSV